MADHEVDEADESTEGPHARPDMLPTVATAQRLLCVDSCPQAKPTLTLSSPSLLRASFDAEKDVSIARRSEGAYERRACPRRTVMGGGGAGSGEESHRALQAAHCVTFCCTTCGSLVDFLASCRAFAKASRAQPSGRTGCASRQCSSRFRCSEFVRSQRKMARAILDGTRVLIRAPIAPDTSAMSVLRRTDATRAARDALLRVGGYSAAHA